MTFSIYQKLSFDHCREVLVDQGPPRERKETAVESVGPGLSWTSRPLLFPLCHRRCRQCAAAHLHMKIWEKNVSEDLGELVLEPEGLSGYSPTRAVTVNVLIESGTGRSHCPQLLGRGT